MLELKLHLEFTRVRDLTKLCILPKEKTATMSHMSSRVPPNLRVQLFRLFSRNPHDSCIPCKEKHGLQCLCSLDDHNDKNLPQWSCISSFLRDIVATTVAVTFYLQSTSSSILCNVSTQRYAHVRGIGIKDVN